MKQINLQPEDTLYVLGDVIDRNPDGIKILRQIMAMPNAKMLLGNHELMMMNALYYPSPEDEEWPEYYYERKQSLWYRNVENNEKASESLYILHIFHRVFRKFRPQTN